MSNGLFAQYTHQANTDCPRILSDTVLRDNLSISTATEIAYMAIFCTWLDLEHTTRLDKETDGRDSHY